MPVLAPITRSTHEALRAAVLEHKERDRRRRPPPTVHVGLPARHSALFVQDPGDAPDPWLAADVVAALLQRSRGDLAGVNEGPVPVPLVWLTRAGSLDTHDADVVWAAATRAAYAEAGLVPTFVVVTRDGWVDPFTGVGREWRRLRRRSGTCPLRS